VGGFVGRLIVVRSSLFEMLMKSKFCLTRSSSSCSERDVFIDETYICSRQADKIL